MFRRIVTLAAAACCASVAVAQDTKAPKPSKPDAPKVAIPAGEQPKATAPETKATTLTVGDRAPALKVDKWVKGEPVTEFQSGKVYVVEFWATWCGPCVKSMPHNTEVQTKFKDKGVTVIGVTSEDPNNKLSGVEKMVKDKGDEKMGYTVAWDSGRKTNEAYMKAANEPGIPCAFIIDKQNRVAWIGHPMYMEEPLEKIVAGKWDLQAAASERKKAQEEATKAAEAAAKSRPAQMALRNALSAEDWDAALKACDDLMALDAKQFAPVAGQKFMILLTKKNDADKAYAYGRQAVAGPLKDSAQGLNEIAWTIVDPEAMPEKPDFDLALSAATRASELTKGEDPMILDTLARAHFLKGNLDKAIEIQTKAVELSKDNEQIKDEVEHRLEEYKAKKSGK
jgi:thiol-disulfide isomerase/thioredoxin